MGRLTQPPPGFEEFKKKMRVADDAPDPDDDPPPPPQPQEVGDDERAEMERERQRLLAEVAECRKRLERLPKVGALDDARRQIEGLEEELQNPLVRTDIAWMDVGIEDVNEELTRLEKWAARRPDDIKALEALVEELKELPPFAEILDLLTTVTEALDAVKSDDPPTHWKPDRLLNDAAPVVERAKVAADVLDELDAVLLSLTITTEIKPFDDPFADQVQEVTKRVKNARAERTPIDAAVGLKPELAKTIKALTAALAAAREFAAWVAKNPKGRTETRWEIAGSEALAKEASAALLKADGVAARSAVTRDVTQKLLEKLGKTEQQKPRDKQAEERARVLATWPHELNVQAAKLKDLPATPAVTAANNEIEVLRERVVADPFADTEYDAIPIAIGVLATSLDPVVEWATELAAAQKTVGDLEAAMLLVPNKGTLAAKHQRAGELIVALRNNAVDPGTARPLAVEAADLLNDVGPLSIIGKDIQKLNDDLDNFAPNTGIPRLDTKLTNRAKDLKEDLRSKQPSDGDPLKFTSLVNQVTTDFQDLRDRLNNDVPDFLSWLDGKGHIRDTKTRREVIDGAVETMTSARSLWLEALSELVANGAAAGKNSATLVTTAVRDITDCGAEKRNISFGGLSTQQQNVLTAIRTHPAVKRNFKAGGNGVHHTNPVTGGNGTSTEYYAVGDNGTGTWVYQSNNPKRFISHNSKWWYTDCHYVNSNAKPGEARKMAYKLIVGL